MNSKKCTNCETAIPEGAKFCPDCGTPANGKPAKKKTTGKSTAMRDNLIIVGVIFVVAVGFFWLKPPSELPQPVKPPQQMGDNENPHGGVSGMTNIPNMPTDYEGLINMGNTTMDQGNYAMAAECYKRALLIKNDDNVRTDFGACLHGMGLENRALEEFRMVLNNNPKHPIANFNMGIVYFGMDQKDSAKVYWEKYLKIDPEGNAAEAVKKYLQEI